MIAGDTAYLLKTTHNERMSSVAPGMILRRHFIESLYVREPGVRRIEIYGALNESQRPWITGVREMYHANAYRGSGDRRAALAVAADEAAFPHAGAGQLTDDCPRATASATAPLAAAAPTSTCGSRLVWPSAKRSRFSPLQR